MLKKILWSARHKIEKEQEEELKNKFGYNAEISCSEWEYSNANTIMTIAKDFDVIAIVVNPEMMASLVKLNSASAFPKIILISIGKFIETQNIVIATGKRELKYKHSHFEKIDKYIYDIETITGTNISGVTSIALVSENELNKKQVEDLKGIYGKEVNISNVSETIRGDDIEEFCKNLQEYDVIALVMTKTLLENVWQKMGKEKQIVISRGKRRKDTNEFEHLYWIKINNIDIRTKPLEAKEEKDV